jgi:predicted outer membrane repeat protein
MKKIFITIVFYFAIHLLALPGLHSQTIYFQGTVNNDTLLNADTIKVTGNIDVLNGVTLSIIQGAYVEFQDYYALNVQGRLLAVGDISDTICFSVHDTTGFSDTSTVNGSWHGIHFDSTLNSNDTSKIIYCKLQFGKAKGGSISKFSGGAIYVNNYSKILISNSLICNNIAFRSGGGIYCGKNSSPTIQYCSFSFNRSYDSGGGLLIGANSNAKIVGNIFTNNVSFRTWSMFSTGCGGGIYSSSADLNSFCPSIINNRVFNNKSISGGGIYESNYHISLVNNLICNNEGGGVLNGHQLGQGKYISNTICNNDQSGGIDCFSSYMQITNNIIWGNTNNNGSTNQINLILSAHPIVKYNNIQYGYVGEGNIDSLPLFMLPTAGAGLAFNGAEADWSLQNHSPCIDSGTPDTNGLNLPLIDILGNPRISYNRIDIGAIEKQFPVGLISDQSDEINIFPNPAYDKLYIQTSMIGTVKFEMYNLNRKIVLECNLVDSFIQLDLGLLEPGLYFYRLTNRVKVLDSGKLIKL